jgi:poly(A) polymerase
MMIFGEYGEDTPMVDKRLDLFDQKPAGLSSRGVIDDDRPANEPVGRIHPQPWMTAPETRSVLEALSVAGTDVRFIGGCVRDTLLHRPIRDIDIAVPLPPLTVMDLLRKAGIKVVATGIDHGTVTAVIGRINFEITTLRVDVETDGRRARVAFTDDWIADAARRDFTINALSCTPEGDIYDYFGGVEDLGHGRVRFVGNARERINEDVLRLLRFFRFYAHFGRPPPDTDALAACRERAPDVRLLSGERVRVEIFRTLMAGDPADVFLLMASEHVLEHVLPEAGSVGRLRMLSWLDSRALRIATVHPDPVRRLAALLSTDAGGVRAVAQRLKLSNRQGHRLLVMIDPPFRVDPDSGLETIRRALHHCGAEAVRDLALLAWSAELALTPRLPRSRTDAWIALIATIDSWVPTSFPLKGRDALAAGIPHGPQVGEILKEIERWWEAGDFRATREQCLARLEELLTARGAKANPL